MSLKLCTKTKTAQNSHQYKCFWLFNDPVHIYPDILTLKRCLGLLKSEFKKKKGRNIKVQFFIVFMRMRKQGLGFFGLSFSPSLCFSAPTHWLEHCNCDWLVLLWLTGDHPSHPESIANYVLLESRSSVRVSGRPAPVLQMQANILFSSGTLNSSFISPPVHSFSSFHLLYNLNITLETYYHHPHEWEFSEHFQIVFALWTDIIFQNTVCMDRIYMYLREFTSSHTWIYVMFM